MHMIMGISSHAPAGATQAGGVNNVAGAGFNLALANPSTQADARGVSSTAAPSLGTQTVSTLLQTQNLNQTQPHGGGGHSGGGHHHTGMNITPGVEIEEAAESEAGQMLRRRKPLMKTAHVSDMSDWSGVDDAEEADAADGQEEDKKQS